MKQELKDALKSKYMWLAFAVGIVVGLGLRSIGVM